MVLRMYTSLVCFFAFRSSFSFSIYNWPITWFSEEEKVEEGRYLAKDWVVITDYVASGKLH